MSKENSSLNPYFAWSLILILILLASIFVVKWPVFSQAADVNLASITTVKDWRQKSKDLSQIICQENVQPAALAVNDNQSAVIDAARRAYFAGDCESALTYWTMAVEENPRNETAAIMRYLSSGLDREMLPAQIAATDMSIFLRNLGFVAEQNQMEDQAWYWFTNAFDIKPSRILADRLVIQEEDAAQQTQVWQQLAETLPDNDPDYWWAVGQIAELNQDWERAAEAYMIGLEIASDPYDFLFRRGKVFTKLAAWEEARNSFEQASTIKPRRIEPFLEVGHILRRQKNFDDAAAAYEQALVHRPNNFSANYYAGLSYFRLEDDQRAQQLLRRALELRPKHADSASLLAYSLKRDGDAQTAREMLEYAIGLQEEKSWNWLKTLGDWRFTDGDIDGALSAYEEALEIQPSSRALQNRLNELKGTR
jgi:tetratricopeptide (TPR) repeat protein